MIDTKELRRLTQAALAGPDGISLSWVKLLQDFQQEANPTTVSELLDRLEAAENETASWKGLAKQFGNEADALRLLVVMRFDHDHPPQFAQGYYTHELTEPVTAEHCRWFVAEIERLRAEVAHIKEVEFPRKAQAVADGWRGKLEAAEEERDDVAQQLVQSEQGKRKISEERDALSAELSKQQTLTVAAQHIAEVAQRRATRLQAKVTEMEKQEPVKQEFQGRDGGWYPFINQRHYENTVADGTWPIRALYALPGAKGE